MQRLRDRVALITGASASIGYATAKLCVAEGAKVAVTGRRREKLDRLVAEIRASGADAVALSGDVQEERFAKESVDAAVSHFGRLDVAFNNAGELGAMGPTKEVSLADWNRTIATNLTSAFLGAKYQIPAMEHSGGGCIIFTSSFVGNTAAMPQMAAYAASKAGLVGLAKALATELATKEIRVNALLPGGTDTDMGRTVASSPELLAFVQGLHALKRIAKPEEIARSALYLASSDSSFTTGTALLVDGGISIQRA